MKFFFQTISNVFYTANYGAKIRNNLDMLNDYYGIIFNISHINEPLIDNGF